MSTRFGLVLFLVLGLLAFAPTRADATTSVERRMVSLINKARVSRHRAPLRLNDGLSNYARRHSRTMAARDRLYHNPRLARWLSNWNWRILGENVGVGGNVDSLHRAFWRSLSHRRNIVDRRFRDVGVGIVRDGSRIYVTVIFRG